MKLPYGISNFKTLREEGYLYIDKTWYLDFLESFGGRYLFFIRPRRFGKSLFLSTLAHYYDLNRKEEFAKLFEDLEVGRRPTPSRNSYLVLELDFSGLNTSGKSELESSFRMRLANSVIGFLHKYQQFFGDIGDLECRIRNAGDVSSILDALLEEVKKTSHKIYLIIDEYDHFANDIVAMGDDGFYKELIRAAGLVRDFYETVKIGTKSVIDRIFITGISPILLDDLSSGFYIAANISQEKSLNSMLGFSETEVNSLLARLGKTPAGTANNLRALYNGYLFHSSGEERVYNPDMVLYYCDSLLRNNEPPAQLIDDIVKTDYGRLNRLTMNPENQRVLEEIIKNDGVTANLVTKFSFDLMYDPEYFVSLLFYMGLLTIRGVKHHTTELVPPNYVIKTIFWEYLSRRLREQYQIKFPTAALSQTIWQMAFEGKIEPFLDLVGNEVLRALSNRDLIQFDEKYLKVILFAYLALSNLYQPVSEREVESGYLDIYLEKDIRAPEVKYEWLLELKYLPKGKTGDLERVKREGMEQLKRYAASQRFAGKTDLKQAVLIFVGKDEWVVLKETN